MKHLKDWLGRLGSASELLTHVSRAFHAGTPIQATSEDVIALKPKGTVPAVPGDTGPVSLSMLYFVDTLPLSEHTLLLSEELGALLCLASGRRVSVPSELPLQVKGQAAVHFLQFSNGIDRELIGPLPPDTIARALGLLSHIAQLPDDDVTILTPPLRLYYGACNIVEKDVRSAYVLLVAALEILSRRYGSPPHDWADWEDAEHWDRTFLTLSLTSSFPGYDDSRTTSSRQTPAAQTHLL